MNISVIKKLARSRKHWNPRTVDKLYKLYRKSCSFGSAPPSPRQKQDDGDGSQLGTDGQWWYNTRAGAHFRVHEIVPFVYENGEPGVDYLIHYDPPITFDKAYPHYDQEERADFEADWPGALRGLHGSLDSLVDVSEWAMNNDNIHYKGPEPFYVPGPDVSQPWTAQIPQDDNSIGNSSGDGSFMDEFINDWAN